jgi:hypothetical protein
MERVFWPGEGKKLSQATNKKGKSAFFRFFSADRQKNRLQMQLSG